MLELYYWVTPNNHKITLFLEEAGLEYKLRPVNLQRQEQFGEEFLKVSPNNKTPALVDHAPEGGGPPLSLFESGAILQYLGRKTNKFYPSAPRERARVEEWLFWQMAGLGPISGQLGHFAKHATERVPYAIKRYQDEVSRLLKVADQRLENREFLVDQYSIADMACYPWMILMPNVDLSLDPFPNLKRWAKAIEARPATVRAYKRAEEFQPK